MAIDPFVGSITDQNKADVEGLIETDRVEAELDDVFNFPQSALEREDVKVVNKPGGTGVDKTKSMGDQEFEHYTNRLKSSDEFSFQSNERYWRADISELDSPNPAKITQSRSKDAVRQDRDKKARVTTDVDRYASDPDSYDYPFVDTPPEFNEEFRTSTLGGSRLLFGEIREQENDDKLFRF